MSRNSKKKSEADILGEKRMEKFEERQKAEPTPIIQSKDDDSEEYTVTAYQKIEPGEWERVEITYKRKRR
jgi:hypothetical protein